MLQGYQGSLFTEVEPYFLSNHSIEAAPLTFPFPSLVIPDRAPKPDPQPECDPLEHDAADVAEATHDTISQLEQRRTQLLALGVAPAGCWLEKAKCHKRKAYQVFYRAEQPIFAGRKRLYVGMEGSLAVRDAEAAIARRNELKHVDRLLKRLAGDERS
ncbi:hypothetical protein ACN4EG_21085 [Alkalinema pantanalense CENA528]|uniref:hypothetical protein n=1 Tax=Alkalinema pantanalense TaxID=1620705 RepID=UPI003D6E9AF4